MEKLFEFCVVLSNFVKFFLHVLIPIVWFIIIVVC